MAPEKRPPSERRRRVVARKRKGAKPPFIRPREWAEQELIGVKGWIARLEGAEGETYPPDWRKGQLRHYRNRAKELRAEIKRYKASEKKAE